MNNTTPMKTCPKCNQEKPMTSQYWYRDKYAHDGVYSWCRQCKKTHHKPSKGIACMFPLSEKICSRCKTTYPATLEFFGRNANTHCGLNSYCHDCISAINKEQRTTSGYKESQKIMIEKYKQYNENRNPYEEYETKRCGTCKRTLPVGDFHLDKRRPDGLKGECKECSKARALQWAKDNPDRTREILRKSRLKRYSTGRRIEYNNPVSVTEKLCCDCKCVLPYTEFYTSRQTKDGLYSSCKSCLQKRLREYKMRNKEHIRAYNRNWSKRHKSYYAVYAANRIARQQDLPFGLTTEDWQRALEYFNGCCAVCGRQLNDLFGTHFAAKDHWIPVSYEGSDNPGTVATNIVPLCHGEDGCNNKKNAKLPDVWLKQEYGTRKAAQILTRINTYFEWIKIQNEKPV